jgi:hypothetical protein
VLRFDLVTVALASTVASAKTTPTVASAKRLIIADQLKESSFATKVPAVFRWRLSGDASVWRTAHGEAA